MKLDELRLLRARRASTAARARLTGTLVELQHRLRPKVLFDDAVEEVREKADEIVRDAIDAAKQRPVAAAAIVLGIVAWLFRGKLASLVESVFSRLKATDNLDES
jgi:hypothetical protein